MRTAVGNESTTVMVESQSILISNDPTDDTGSRSKQDTVEDNQLIICDPVDYKTCKIVLHILKLKIRCSRSRGQTGAGDRFRIRKDGHAMVGL